MYNDVFASVFRAILTMSIAGGIIALSLFALKPLLRNRLPKTAQYCLWIVALAAFLIPASTFVAIPNPGGAPTVNGFIEQRVFSGSEYLERQMLERTGHSAQISLPEAERMPADDKEQTVQVRADARTREFWLNFLVAKMPFVGALSILFTNLLGYWSFLLRLRRGNKRYETDCPVPVFSNANAATPMLIGLFNPAIILPDREYTEEQLRSVLLHELTHLRRKDILIKWLSVLACSLHWFNPLAWLMRRELDRACELACDEAVIRRLDEDGRQSYGDTLIAVAADSKMPRTVLSTTMCERKKSLKERLGAIMSYKKSSRLALICSVALVILLAGCAAMLGAGERNRTVDEIIGSDDPRFRGVVEEVYDEAILVRVNEGEEIRKSSDLIHVSLLNANPDAAGGYSIGDTVCVYFDGVVAESYPAQVSAYAVLVEERSPLGIIPDTIDAPDFALEVAVDWAKGDFEGYRDIGVAAQKELGAAFDNWRLEYIEHAYRYDDMSIEIYRFEWRIHTTTPDKIRLAGGMELSEDGWLLDTYPGSWYLLFEDRDGELVFLTVMGENDCAPGDEAFTRDMLNRISESGVAPPARDMLNVYQNSDLGITWTFPESWNGEWNVVASANGGLSLTGDGVNVWLLGSVIRHTTDEWTNDFHNGADSPVRYKVLASSPDYVYVFMFASDLEWDRNNPDAEKTYNRMTEDIYNGKTVFTVDFARNDNAAT